jgi:ferredoxin
MTMARTLSKVSVNPIACSGHGVCAELLPELISLDEWGYPLIAGDGVIPAQLARTARRAVTDCPALALLLAPRGNSEEAQRPAGLRGGTLGT